MVRGFFRSRAKTAVLVATIAYGAPSPMFAAQSEIGSGDAAKAKAPAAGQNQDVRQYCSNIAVAAESARLARQQKELTELEQKLEKRLAEFEAKRAQLQGLVDRREAFDRKTDEALVGLYSRMKPDSAAAQLAQLEEDAAAALLVRLKAKISSAILNEMDAARGAAIARRIAASAVGARDGKTP
jgi:flagellar motility protein MotE (MotC chaperone)